jgi:hypothetical protein
VLRPDVIVPQLLRFPYRELERLFRAGCEGDVADRWDACLPSISAPGRSDPVKRSFTERFLDPAADFVQVDTDDSKRRRVLLTQRQGLTLAHNSHDLRPDIVETDAESIERPTSHARAVVQKSQQEVFRSKVVVMDTPRFLLGEDNRPPGAVREMLEHRPLPPRKEPPTRVLLVDRLLTHLELPSDLLPRPTEVPRVLDLERFELFDQATERRHRSKTDPGIAAARLACDFRGLGHAVNIR